MGSGMRDVGNDGVLSRGATAACFAVSFVLLAVLAPVANAEPWEDFDHFRTRFPLVGAHERTTCEECHRGGLFTGAPTRCGSCHDGTGFRAQTSKDFAHIFSTEDCDDCHLLNAWVPSRLDHGAVRGSCFSCHNGITAQGKHATHTTSSNFCELCHSSGRWLPARFDHFGISGSCRTCHADDVPAGHFPTTADCFACHSTTRWSPTIPFRHTSPNYPGDHAGNLDCVRCHEGNTDVVIYQRPDLAGYCAGCHASDFQRDKHRNKQTGQLYTVEELRDCSASCHVEDNGRPEHRVSDGDWD